LAYWQARVDRRSWAIVEKKTNQAVGLLTLSDSVVGFETRQRFRNRGYMTEALRAVAARFERITGEVAAGNHASQRVFEKAGFRVVRRTVWDGQACLTYASEEDSGDRWVDCERRQPGSRTPR
jgi:RimJ/RimL family protein N-acetyltransferase